MNWYQSSQWGVRNFNNIQIFQFRYRLYNLIAILSDYREDLDLVEE
jgi:hypothetical protein